MAGKTLSEKLIEKHLVEGKMIEGKEIAIKVDDVLTQDATGTMAFLQFEALGIDKVQTEQAVSFVDHNLLQTGFEGADDHKYLETVAQKYGVIFSKPGNGICHQVFLERFSRPGKVLLGSDSHTPTCGGAGMLAIGAGGLDVALALGGMPFRMKMPKVVGIKLSGKLSKWVSAKDVILNLLQKLTVKGGKEKIFEYFGDGVKTLSVYERATITNMGAELGLTTSIFPADKNTLEFLKKRKRSEHFAELSADKGATYDEIIELNLSEFEPMIAKPHSPDNVVPVSTVAGTKIEQVCVGSCTNSSYHDLAVAAKILKGKKVDPSVSLTISPGSKQVLETITHNGLLEPFINAGARILESACGPCIGMGQVPTTNGVSLRTFNRNFQGRSGSATANIYLCSVETAVVSALTGKITDPRKFGKYPAVKEAKKYKTNDSLLIFPPKDSSKIEVIRGPNIAPLPIKEKLQEKISGTALIKVQDDVSTDAIMPAGAQILPLRSNVPKISEFVFSRVDPEFAKRAKERNGGMIVGGENYGQGSSREHAALAPMYLGIKAVLAKSFARIHQQNLINFGILPLEFKDKADYSKITKDDELEIINAIAQLKNGKEFEVQNKTNGQKILFANNFSQIEKEILTEGGMLNYTKQKIKERK